MSNSSMSGKPKPRRPSLQNMPEFAVLFDGQRSFGRSKTQVELILVQHVKFSCVELVIRNSDVDIENSRQYFEYEVLANKIDSAKFKLKFARKSEEISDPDIAASETIKDLIVEYFLQHLVVAKNPKSLRSCMVLVEDGQSVNVDILDEVQLPSITQCSSLKDLPPVSTELVAFVPFPIRQPGTSAKLPGNNVVDGYLQLCERNRGSPAIVLADGTTAPGSPSGKSLKKGTASFAPPGSTDDAQNNITSPQEQGEVSASAESAAEAQEGENTATVEENPADAVAGDSAPVEQNSGTTTSANEPTSSSKPNSGSNKQETCMAQSSSRTAGKVTRRPSQDRTEDHTSSSRTAPRGSGVTARRPSIDRGEEGTSNGSVKAKTTRSSFDGAQKNGVAGSSSKHTKSSPAISRRPSQDRNDEKETTGRQRRLSSGGDTADKGGRKASVPRRPSLDGHIATNKSQKHTQEKTETPATSSEGGTEAASALLVDGDEPDEMTLAIVAAVAAAVPGPGSFASPAGKNMRQSSESFAHRLFHEDDDHPHSTDKKQQQQQQQQSSIVSSSSSIRKGMTETGGATAVSSNNNDNEPAIVIDPAAAAAAAQKQKAEELEARIAKAARRRKKGAQRASFSKDGRGPDEEDEDEEEALAAAIAAVAGAGSGTAGGGTTAADSKALRRSFDGESGEGGMFNRDQYSSTVKSVRDSVVH